jgi:hypothetical protein
MHDDFPTQNDFPTQILPIPPLPERAEAAPFIIEHRQEDSTGSSFRPSARLILTERVRTSGLWRSLTPEDFTNLTLLLSFITPNGWCRPTLPELADAMGVAPAKAKSRLDRLVRGTWQDQPLVEMLGRPDGLDAYLPGRLLVAHEDIVPREPVQVAPMRTPGREAVVAYSRARYAKTREEVERQIGEMMGWGPPAFAGDDPAVAQGKQKAFQAMTGFGMPKEQALDLLSRFDLGAVESQISWLPQRNAKNPARFLAAAIEGNYDRPLALRRQTGGAEPGNRAELENRAEPEHGAEHRAESEGDGATGNPPADDISTDNLSTDDPTADNLPTL